MKAGKNILTPCFSRRKKTYTLPSFAGRLGRLCLNPLLKQGVSLNPLLKQGVSLNPLLKQGVSLLLFFLSHAISAQDIHFTQYINSHLTLNPALTGFFDGNIRAAMINRSQWASIATPYSTSAFSFDTKILQKIMNDNGFGVGVIFLTDKSGSYKFTNFMALLSTSYIKSLSTLQDKYIAFGIQGGFFQKGFNISDLRFGNQYDGLDFNPSQPSGEQVPGNSIWNGDINAGIDYHRNPPFLTHYNAGIAFFHLNQPYESFFKNETRRSVRTVFHSNIRFLYSEGVRVGPDLFYAFQKNASEINLGGSLTYKLPPVKNKVTYLNLSAGYRWSDAVNFSTGIKYGKWIISFSYDTNISELVPASNYLGGYEISIIYTDLIVFGKKKLPYIVPCGNL